MEEVLSHLQWQVEQCRTEERRQRGRLILRGFRAAVAAFESTTNMDKIDALLREEIFGKPRKLK
ncbi:hypothetical protein [Pseudomonas sp. AP-1]|uniref:hypothetical protein n=1 Tax=Pseudomonas sp. AP-1 TaxID=3231718 RepID=UPI0035B23641